MRQRLGFALAAVLSLSCEEEPVDATPAGAVTEFVYRMRNVHGDKEAAQAAYELLWSQAKRNLAERAKRASAVTGRTVSPEEMIAPSGFSLRFEPREYEATVQGDWALVTVSGDLPSERHTVKCLREDGAWRVVVALPPLPPIQKRPDAGGDEL